MNVEVSLNGAAPVIRALNGAASKVHEGWRREAFTVGARAVSLMKAKRKGMPRPTWPGDFAVRTGAFLNSYAHAVKGTRNGFELAVGAIKPTATGQIPIHVRVHEGFTENGGRVKKWIIRPRKAAWLVFPLRSGGGLAKSNIYGWVRTKLVQLPSTPVVEPVGRDIPAALKLRCAQVFQDVLRAT